ncbi:MAG: DNA polymerase I [Thermoflexales bacterium]|nr:DNA polymerase I [Thermoflexales bacterium]
MRLVLIDGHALAYRAFHALPLEGFATRDGEPTNATYGFTSTLLHILQELKPDYIAVCFDAGHSGRDEIFPDYKAHRDRMPDEMRVQMDRIRQIVQAFGIPIFEVPGVEADDLMGALARQAAAQGLETVIVTGDKDLLQLVSPGVKVFLAGRRLSDGTVYDEEAVRARYGGLSPAQLRDFKALVGDKSDNIPGVNGVGEKGATDLLRKYGSLEEIYSHLDEVTPPRYREALEKNRDVAFLSQQLATIRTDLSVQLDLEACTVRNYDRARVTELFRQLEFRSLLDRLPEALGKAPTAPEVPETAAPSRPTQLPLFEAPEAKKPPRRAVPTVPHIVREPEELAVLVEQLSRAPAVTFDTETTSEDPIRAALVGLAFTDREGEGWYIPVGHRRGRQLPLPQVLEAVRPLLEDPSVPKQAHHAKYDMTVLARHGVRVRGLAFDTMIAEWLCDPASHNLGLKSLAFIRLGVEMTTIQDLIGSGRRQVTMAEVEIEDAAAYAAADVDMTHRLVRVLEPELRQKGHWDLFTKIELPLVEVLMEMEMTGVALDVDFLKGMSAELGARMAELEERIQGMVGMPFNINSGPQLAEVLFGVLRLPTKGVPRTSTGRYSLTAEVLESLRGAHPIVDLILEHRELAKLKSTYVDALPALVNPATGRLHTSYHQTGTVTGRISSSDPNLQNIPIRSPLGRQVRRAFVARPGWALLGADYSQIELRVLAHISGDPGLTAAFQRGEDIHASTAAAIFDIPIDQVTPEQRRFAKQVNFGLVYGMSVARLARDAGIPQMEAENFVSQYFGRFPKVREYLERTLAQAKNQGYVETILGRRRYFPVLQSVSPAQEQARRRAEREAVNAPIQGSAADIIKLAMLNLHRALHERGLAARMILQVHDELVLEVPQEELPVVAPLVREIMESAYPLRVPLKVDLSVGPNWGEMEG